MLCPNTGTKFREPYNSNHLIPRLVSEDCCKVLEEITFSRICCSNNSALNATFTKIPVTQQEESIQVKDIIFCDYNFLFPQSYDVPNTTDCFIPMGKFLVGVNSVY